MATAPAAEISRDLLARLPGRLAGRVSVGIPPESRALEGACLATGRPELDAALSGGLPRGRLAEVCGRGSTGKLTLVLGALRTALERGEAAALVDLTGTACPGEPWAAGRLLVVRPATLHEALRAVDVLVESAAFSAVALEASGSGGLRPILPEPLQVRLSRLARETGCCVVACADRPLLGPLAALRLELVPRADGPVEVFVRKSRTGGSGGSVLVARQAAGGDAA